MSNKLEIIISEQDLSKPDVQKLVEAFGGPFSEAGAILSDFDKDEDGNIVPNEKTIVVSSETETELMTEAREKRLILKKARTTVENKRKELKSDIVKQGRAIDAVARYVKEEIQPAEEYLQLQEDFVKIKKEKEAAKLKAERIEKLSKYSEDISLYNLDDMSDEKFESLYDSVKKEYENKVEAQKEAERIRLAEEEAERKRIEEQAKENARLKAEAEIREKQIEAERKAEAERLAKVEAEREKERREQLAKLEAERKKREAVEQEQREKAEAERKAKLQKEEEDRQALLAPDKEKLISFANGLNIVRSEKIPAVKTKQAQDILNQVDKELANLIELIMSQARGL